MDYRTLNEAIAGMNDEQLFLIEKKVNEERTRRLALSLAPAPQLGDVTVLIDLAPLTNAVRENLRHAMSITSPAALASVLDQIRDYTPVDEVMVIKSLQGALTLTFIHEARCETERRVDSVR